MADEHDSWFKPFGFDPAQFAKDTYNKAEAAVTSVVQDVRTTVNSAVDTVTGAVTSVVTSAVPALAPGPAAKPGANGKKGGGTVSTLGGSVGAGGANNPDDVKAVQKALGIADDGQCGGGTIGTIKAFQKSLGQANPDGRIDPGGPTARALAGGGSAPAPEDEGFFDGLKKTVAQKLEDGVNTVEDLGAKMLQDAEDLIGSMAASVSGNPANEVSAADFAKQLAQWKKCVGDCQEQFQRCIKGSNNAQECLAALSACLRRCPPEPSPPPEPPPPPKPACTLPHPTGLITTGRTSGIGYGFKTILTWKSTSGNLADLKDCEVSEHIIYSKIPNPPYGLPSGTPVAESERKERKKPFGASLGKLQDTHRAPSEWVGNPPRSEGSFTVTQTYDYKCPGCGDAWIPFAHYVIKYEVRKEGGEWVHVTTKVGSAEQSGESLDITEAIH